ncbi:hypothetical protein EVAR_6227_1 [Eumeta japonica]|uniref:Uncharacterized protein n=1 Tax=Eumeta variegata TaxID=151549 RepID=A0A4C1TB62_EUMVA|nr:hypothetical protein EVAR_6227_1 [Eumeta japonica]
MSHLKSLEVKRTESTDDVQRADKVSWGNIKLRSGEVGQRAAANLGQPAARRRSSPLSRALCTGCVLFTLYVYRIIGYDFAYACSSISLESSSF